MESLKPFAVFVFGPPGSGKSTQAAFLAQEFGAVDLDSGELLREMLHDPSKTGDPKIKEEKAKYDAGQLNDSMWVESMVIQKVKELAAEGKSIIFSGNPRTLVEADKEIPEIQILYPGRMAAFSIVVKDDTSLFRNTKRKICTECGRVFPWSPNEPAPLLCPDCGGTVSSRPDDTSEIIGERLKVFHRLTEPVLNYLRSKNIPVIEIDGEPLADIVSQSLKENFLKVLG
ncbi:MAG: nucleoside monophosphate kinase [Candidatus Sungbacteria bacterium]|uniref:Adenylate kinase n=1 Tax=Candidatus Sungiibacteriota bacterium TaxID=2750080 RepID=A0A9D6LN10_9BACT|nr:nucleoside monophosphate kinase [Candidatus Sungbacteria bacterium]